MKNTFNEFKKFRIYRNLSLPTICNLIFCNRIMKIKPFVSNASFIYNYSRKLSTLTDRLINMTFCKVFTAGHTLQEAVLTSQKLKQQSIIPLIDYCAEGDINASEESLDENSKMFAAIANSCANKNNEIMSIKFSGLIKVQLLRDINKSVAFRNNFWLKYSQNGLLKGEKMFSGLQEIYDGITDEHFCQYLSQIHRYSGDPKEFTIDETEFKMNHMPYYLFQEQKNQNFVINLFFPKTNSLERAFFNLKKRIANICDKHCQNNDNFRIVIDAEQSYIQKAIEVFSEQMQAFYNRQRLYIIPTVQNYLKQSVQRSKYEIQIVKRRKIFFGAKLVRGAYLMEESRIYRQIDSNFPIVSCFSETTANYLASFKKIAQSGLKKGQIIIASHNQKTIQDAINIAQQAKVELMLSFAQLFGLGDHLTYKLKSEGYQVYKLLPWAETKIMIAYMIRRAQQLSQMRYPLDDQYQLLKHELRERYIQ